MSSPALESDLGSLDSAELQLRLNKLQLEVKAAELRAQALELEAQLAKLRKAEQKPEPKAEPSPNTHANANIPLPVIVESEPVAEVHAPVIVVKEAPKPTKPSKPQSVAQPKAAVQPKPVAQPKANPQPKATAAPAVVPAPPPAETPALPAKVKAQDTAKEADAKTGTANQPSSEEERKPWAAFNWFSRMFRGAPPWVVSTALHAVIIMILALLSVAFEQQVEELPLLSVYEAPVDDVTEIEDVELELDSLDESDNSTLMGDIGLASLGEMVSAVEQDTTGSVDVGRVDVSTDGIGLEMDGAHLGKGMDGVSLKSGSATFFGTSTTGSRFIFVVDNSKSMAKGKFEKANAELVRSIENLKPQQSFYVMYFSDKSYPLFWPQDQDRFAYATPQNIAKLKKWVSETQLYLSTKPYESMITAVEMKPDAIFFLTDGQLGDKTEPTFTGKDNPNKKRYDLDSDDPRYGTQIPIHTIGFTSKQGEPTLKNISEHNSGTYRFVP